MGCYSCGSPSGTEATLCKECIAERQAKQKDRLKSLPISRDEIQRPRASGFRLFLGTIAVIALAGGLAYYLFIYPKGPRLFDSSRGIPDVEEVRPAIQAFLISEEKQKCDGEIVVEHLEVLRVEANQEDLGGFPVYADFSLVCKKTKGNITSTVRWDNKEDRSAMIAVARRTAFGRYQASAPRPVQEEQAQAEVEKKP